MHRERIIAWVNALEDEETLIMLDEWAEEDAKQSTISSELQSPPISVYKLPVGERELLEEASRSVKSGNFYTNEEVNRRAEQWLNE